MSFPSLSTLFLNQNFKNSVLTLLIFNLFFFNTSRLRLSLPPNTFPFFIRSTHTKSAGTCYTAARRRHRPSRETANPVNRVHRYTNCGTATRTYTITYGFAGTPYPFQLPPTCYYYYTADRRRIVAVSDVPLASLRVCSRTPYIYTLCESAVDVRRFARERRPRPEAADKAITLVFELSVASLKI